MIKRIFKGIGTLFAYACLATVIAQVAIFGALWNKGGFDKERRTRLWTYLFEIDREAIRQEVAQAEQAVRYQANYTDRLGAMRRQAEAEGTEQLGVLEAQLLDERTRYQSMRTIFEARLTDLEKRQRDGAVDLVRDTMETLDPALTKDILVRFLDAGALNDVVSILIQMSPDKQRKILAEFQTAEEIQQMNDILLRIRSQSVLNANAPNSSAPTGGTP